MIPRTAIYKLILRLNKLASSDYDNISLPIAVEAINKAALDWVRRQIHGGNLYKESDEESRMRVDDLQFLLKPRTLEGENSKQFFESETFPNDYLYYKRIIAKTSKGECHNKKVKSTLVEEANVPDYLDDQYWKPSFEWQQSFHTLLGDRIRLYTAGEFEVNNIELVYYRRPIKMDIEGYTHEDDTESKNVDLEFKDDVAELIINEAASIIAGDIESINQQQINAQKVENNN